MNCRVFPAEPASDILVAQLADIGYESFVESDTGLLAYIPKKDFDAKALDKLPIIEMGMFDISFDYAEIEEENWNAVWESNYDPVTIEDRCHVRAPFHEPHPAAEYDIVVEPKMSFGTAHHETTYLTVQLMLDMDFSGKTVLDMGSGTGILSILAAKKGAALVEAIDNDRWAYENAIENFKRNNVTVARAVLGNKEAIAGKAYDIIIANINRNTVLQDMASYAAALKATGGRMLLSGFYEHERNIVEKEAAAYGIRYVRHIERNDWVAIEAKK